MTLVLRTLSMLTLVFLLAGCGNSVEETLKNDIFYLEVLNEVDTENGNVVFYKTEAPVETYGAKLLKKSGLDWQIASGTEIPAFKAAEDIAWAVNSTEDERAFFYGIIKNEIINKVTINGNDAEIVNRKQGYNFFYLLTTDGIFAVQKNGEEGIQVEGYSDDGELIYERLEVS